MLLTQQRMPLKKLKNKLQVFSLNSITKGIITKRIITEVIITEVIITEGGVTFATPPLFLFYKNKNGTDPLGPLLIIRRGLRAESVQFIP